MDEKDWLILKTLQEKKSITKTASAVFISQPALSKRLQQMEENFGVALAVRNKSGIELTAEGEYLATCSIEMLDKIRTIDETIRGMRGELRGTLRIGASQFSTKYLLPDIFMRFKEEHPLVEFYLESGWSSDIGRMVNNGELHVGFIRNEHVRAEEKYVLLRERTYICSKKPLSLERLPEEPLINHRTDPMVKARFNAWWLENYAIPPRTIMEVNALDTATNMMEHGLGYAILSELVVNRLGKDIYRYEMFCKNEKPYYRHVWLIYNATARQLRLVATFIDFVLKFKFGNDIDSLRTI